MGKVQETEAGSWSLAGWAGVDSGRLMLADPYYPGRMPSEFLGSDCQPDGVESWAPYGQDIAMIVATPYGDGLFPVSVLRDEEDRITSVRVDFSHEARQAAHQLEDGS